MTRVTDLPFTVVNSDDDNPSFIVVESSLVRRLNWDSMVSYLRENITGADQRLATTSSVRFRTLSASAGTFSNLAVYNTMIVGGLLENTLNTLSNTLSYALIVTNDIPDNRNDTGILLRGYKDNYQLNNTSTNYPFILGEFANRTYTFPTPVIDNDRLLSVAVSGYTGRNFVTDETGQFAGQLTFFANETWEDTDTDVTNAGTGVLLSTQPIGTRLAVNSNTNHVHLFQSWEYDENTPVPLLTIGSGIQGQKGIRRDNGFVLTHEGSTKLKFLNTRITIEGSPREDAQTDNPTLADSNKIEFIANRRSATNLRRNALRKNDTLGRIAFRGQVLNTQTSANLGLHSGEIAYYALEDFTSSTHGTKVLISTINTGTNTATIRLDLNDKEQIYQSDRHVFKSSSGTVIAVLTTASATFYSATINISGVGGGGGGGGGEGLATRSTVTTATSVIAVGATATTSLIGFKTYVLYKVQTNVASYVRIYGTSAGQLADLTRSETVDPDPSRGVIAEVITTSGSLTQIISPAIIGYNNQPTVTDQVFVSLTNKHTTSSTLTVTLTLLKLEA